MRSPARYCLVALLDSSKTTAAFGSIRCRLPSSEVVALFRMSSMTCGGVRVGSSVNNFAAKFATFGEAIDVPDSFILVPPGR